MHGLVFTFKIPKRRQLIKIWQLLLFQLLLFECMHACSTCLRSSQFEQSNPNIFSFASHGEKPGIFFELAKLHSESFFDSKYVCCSAVLPQSGPANHPPCRPGWPTRARCPGRNPRAASIVPGEENNGKVAFSQTSISINQERFGFSRSIIQTCEKPKTSKKKYDRVFEGLRFGNGGLSKFNELQRMSDRKTVIFLTQISQTLSSKTDGWCKSFLPPFASPVAVVQNPKTKKLNAICALL